MIFKLLLFFTMTLSEYIIKIKVERKIQKHLKELYCTNDLDIEGEKKEKGKKKYF